MSADLPAAGGVARTSDQPAADIDSRVKEVATSADLAPVAQALRSERESILDAWLAAASSPAVPPGSPGPGGRRPHPGPVRRRRRPARPLGGARGRRRCPDGRRRDRDQRAGACAGAIRAAARPGGDRDGVPAPPPGDRAGAPAVPRRRPGRRRHRRGHRPGQRRHRRRHHARAVGPDRAHRDRPRGVPRVDDPRRSPADHPDRGVARARVALGPPGAGRRRPPDRDASTARSTRPRR